MSMSPPPPAMALGSGEFAFSLGETIGVGATGKVKLGVHKETGQRVAVKIVSSRLFQEKPELMRKMMRECDIMSQVEHPHVVRYFGKFEDRDNLYLVLELVTGGELFDYLLKTGRQSEDHARKLFRQLISAVHYCHERNVCHRDIKPENLLLDEANNMKVADFGYAQWMHSISDGSRGWVETSCGSPHYASPEVIVGDRYVGNQADVWSCGVVLFALMTGGLPFDDENIQKLLHKVKRGVYQIPSWVPPQARDLIWRMLTVDPNQRITTAQIQQHPWFVGPPAAEATRQVGRFSLSAVPVPPPEPEPQGGADVYEQLLGSGSLSAAQRQALERLQAAQAQASAALAQPAGDAVTHYLQQSESRRQLAVARHELSALRGLRAEMDEQGGGGAAGAGGPAVVDPRAELARLQQIRTADELSSVQEEVRLLQTELGIPLPSGPAAPQQAAMEAMPPPPVPAPVESQDAAGAATTSESLWTRLGFS